MKTQWPQRATIAALAGISLLLLLLAAATPINHDEDQYLAAAMLTHDRRPFVDFLYLQTPLQPWLFSPLFGLIEGWSLMAMRVATALLGIALLLLAYLGGRAAGASDCRARYAMLALASTHIFLFCAGVVRNDMLPAVLAAGGTLAGIKALREPGSLLWLIAGLCFGLAVSAKISYAVPATAVGGFMLFRLLRSRGSSLGLVAYGLGGLVGLVPTLTALASAPEAFLYGVLEYGATAPFDWYAASGQNGRLTPIAKAWDSLVILARGASLLALALVAWDVWRQRRRPAAPEIRFVEMLIVAGLIAALMPTPSWRQYFLPLLTPLFIRASLIDFRNLRWRWAAAAAAILFAAIGAGKHVGYLGNVALTGKWPIEEVTHQAHWIGRTVELGGSVATLSPHLVIDSGVPLVPEFAAGVFAYRTGDRIAPGRQRRLKIVSPRTLAWTLDCRAPVAIATGAESRGGMDETMRRYARRRGYTLVRSPLGAAELYLRTRPPRCA